MVGDHQAQTGTTVHLHHSVITLCHVFSIHSWKIFGYSFYSPEKNPKLNTPLHRVLLGVVRRRQSRWRLGDAEYEGSRAKAVAIPRLQVAKQNGGGASTFLFSQKYVSLNLGICVCVLQVQDQNGIIFRKLNVFPGALGGKTSWLLQKHLKCYTLYW